MRYTQSTIFLLPMLADKSDDIISDNFDNCYLHNINRDKNKTNEITINYSKNCNNEILNRSDYLIDKIKRDVGTFYILKIPEKYISDYNNFLLGRYSKFSNEYKNKMLEFWDTDEEGLLFSILNRTDKIKEKWIKDTGFDTTAYSESAEYWPRINHRDETLKF